MTKFIIRIDTDLDVLQINKAMSDIKHKANTNTKEFKVLEIIKEGINENSNSDNSDNDFGLD